jgi:pimeloyl-ACP methyl ester carboxylesterase
MKTLLLLPGLDGTGLIFQPLLAQLPAEIDAQVVHYPTDRPMSFWEHVDSARRQMPTDKPFVLLAESFSGPVALKLLAAAPDNLVGVIFVATFARYPSPFLLDTGRHLPQALLLKLFATPLFCRFFCLGNAPAKAVKLFRQALQSATLSVLSRRLQILAELPPPPDMAFSGPILYIQAGNDRLVPPRAADAMQKLLPQLRIVQLPGPHIILLAQPEQGARLISDFINGVMDSQ